MEIDPNDFKGFEWGSRVFSVSQKRTGDIVWLKTATEPEEAWRFLAADNTETFALMAVHTNKSGSRTVRKELAMRSNGKLTAFGKKLLWALMDRDIHRALELLEKK